MGELLPWLGESETAAGRRALGGGDFHLEGLRDHRLLPLIFWEVTRRGLAKELPQAGVAELRKAYLLALQAAARQEHEIVPVLQALDRAGIETIILKGADLRHRLYDDPAVRPMYDLDLLIPGPRLREAEKFLVHMGYLPFTEPRPGFVERFENEIAFLPGPGQFLNIDLHFGELRSLGQVYRLPYPRLAAKAQPLDLAGVAAKVLAPEHALIHLCLHALSDFTIFGPAAIPLLDLFLALSRLPLDWDFLVAESVRFRCQGPVYLMLRTMDSLTELAIPPGVLAGLGQYRPAWPERLALQRLGYLNVPLSVLYRHRRLSDWAFFFWSMLWPQENYIRESFGSGANRLRAFLQKLSSIKLGSSHEEIDSR